MSAPFCFEKIEVVNIYINQTASMICVDYVESNILNYNNGFILYTNATRKTQTERRTQ